MLASRACWREESAASAGNEMLDLVPLVEGKVKVSTKQSLPCKERR
jgi:hypothetical protein